MANSSDQFRSLQVGSMDALNELEQDSKANRVTPMTADYAWQELYQAAILETDDGKLADCLPLVRPRLRPDFENCRWTTKVLWKNGKRSAMRSMVWMGYREN
jgi:hypothetical protein